MTTFGYFITRDLSDEEVAELRTRIEGIGGSLPDVNVGSAPIIPASAQVPMPTEQTPGQPLHGDVPYGRIQITWNNGVPQSALDLDEPNSAVAVPQAFWNAMTAVVPQDQWAPFAYIAYQESRYSETVHNSTPPDDSYGAMQINRLAWPQFSPEELQTYRGNLHAAAQVFAAQGYGAWFTSATRAGLI